MPMLAIGGQFVEFRVDAVEPGLYFLAALFSVAATISVFQAENIRAPKIVFIVHSGPRVQEQPALSSSPVS